MMGGVVGDGSRVWHIAVMQPAILNRIELPGNLGAITLYDWMADEVRDGRNLIRTTPDGQEVWRAEPPFYHEAGQQDCFTQVAWDGNNLSAHTWSCFRVAVDLDSGQVETLAFTK